MSGTSTRKRSASGRMFRIQCVQEPLAPWSSTSAGPSPQLRLAVSLFALALIVLSTSAYGQAQKVPRIGVLSTLPAQYAAPYVEAGKAALRDAGYVEGQNISIEYRFAGRSMETLQAQAAELVALKVDVVVVVGDLAIRTIQQATKTIPIVM